MAWLVALALLPLATAGADWPQWGRDGSRNMVSPERGLPDVIELRRGQAGFDPAQSRNIKWVAKLGSITYSSPAVAGGRVYIGTNADVPGATADAKGGGAFLCLDAATGRLLWQVCFPRYMTRDPLFNFDHLKAGVCSSPTVEGDRVYLVNNRAEVVCLDAQAGGKVLWKFDMLTEKHVSCWPQDAADCSPLVLGDLVYVCTSNGVDKSHKRIPRPDAPSIIALDKKTGALVAADDARIGPSIFHGEWSSPALVRVDGRDLIVHGGGDGWCYAFDATPAPGPAGKPAVLRTVWKFDCNPPEYRMKGGKALAYKTPAGPSEIIATPVVWNGRVYVNIGQDPAHGTGAGHLVCIDPRGSGDITKSGLVWSCRQIDRSISTVAIADGLLFTAAIAGTVHCVDAHTGERHWTYDARSPIWGSPLAADGKVYIGTTAGELLILAASRQMRLIHRAGLGGKLYATPVAANGVLYVATSSHLLAASVK
jgi:outer membrane protein assembly factor BamB